MGDFDAAGRIKALRVILGDVAVDGAWVVRPENRFYLSGFRAEDSGLDESSGSLLIGADELILLTDSRFTEQAAREAAGFRVELIKGDFPGRFSEIAAASELLRTGFEKDYLIWGMHARVSGALGRMNPPGELVPLDGEVERLRRVKSSEELEILAAAAKMISDILVFLIDWIAPGMTERSVARRLVELAHEAGADGMSFPPIIASGPNSSLPHAVPTDRKLEKGEPVVIDAGVKLNGYCSDITRTVFLGEPSADFRSVYRIVLKAQREALRCLRAGVTARDVDRAARSVIEDAGFGDRFGHGLGHGVGLAVHEAPRLNPRDSTVLEEGMVVTVEPGVYLPGKGGVRLEETVVVEAGGPRILTFCDRFHDC